MNYPRIVRQMTRIIIAGTWSENGIAERLEVALGKSPAWIRRFARHIYEAFPGPRTPRYETLHRLLHADKVLYKKSQRSELQIVSSILQPSRMQRSRVSRSWPALRLTTDSAISEWLDLTPTHLDWFTHADKWRHAGDNMALQHYYYLWISKRSGGWRLLEVPKSKLKSIQRRILADILNAIPVHPNSCGFSKGSSIRRFVEPHSGQSFVLRMDLADFFPSVEASRVHSLFRAVGYSEHIARTLAHLCTHITPTKTLSPVTERPDLSNSQNAKFFRQHLPQGAPTSPALANLCAFRLDMRLTSLAEKYQLSYTRYADDLLFSGRSMGKALLRQFSIWVGAIAFEEHFEINMRKTRVMKQSVRQHAAGLTLNKRINISRKEFDLLKAILTNCIRSGPEQQNRAKHQNFRAFLLGKISYVMSINHLKGQRLKALFSKIKWNHADV